MRGFVVGKKFELPRALWLPFLNPWSFCARIMELLRRIMKLWPSLIWRYCCRYGAALVLDSSSLVFVMLVNLVVVPQCRSTLRIYCRFWRLQCQPKENE